ncbi:hypothetical protein B0H17DRAFT_1137888 [Mycena rosella]|uniref:Uncharacterized protein n=1 Tax=Mycena rosella TaxID=1033263 RepID=A0AAD7GF03_MYCRO|nr:hypothetical protein B0H17DRAFT_1137888 [Mycena rosella]
MDELACALHILKQPLHLGIWYYGWLMARRIERSGPNRKQAIRDKKKIPLERERKEKIMRAVSSHKADVQALLKDLSPKIGHPRGIPKAPPTKIHHSEIKVLAESHRFGGGSDLVWDHLTTTPSALGVPDCSKQRLWAEALSLRSICHAICTSEGDVLTAALSHSNSVICLWAASPPVCCSSSVARNSQLHSSIPDKLSLFYVRACISRAKRGVHGLKPYINDTVFARLMDFQYLKTQDDLDKFTLWITGLKIKKVQDWCKIVPARCNRELRFQHYPLNLNVLNICILLTTLVRSTSRQRASWCAMFNILTSNVTTKARASTQHNSATAELQSKLNEAKAVKKKNTEELKDLQAKLFTAKGTTKQKCTSGNIVRASAFTLACGNEQPYSCFIHPPINQRRTYYSPFPFGLPLSRSFLQPRLLVRRCSGYHRKWHYTLSRGHSLTFWFARGTAGWIRLDSTQAGDGQGIHFCTASEYSLETYPYHDIYGDLEFGLFATAPSPSDYAAQALSFPDLSMLGNVTSGLDVFVDVHSPGYHTMETKLSILCAPLLLPALSRPPSTPDSPPQCPQKPIRGPEVDLANILMSTRARVPSIQVLESRGLAKKSKNKVWRASHHFKPLLILVQ